MATQEIVTCLIEKFWESVPAVWHQTRATIRHVAVTQFNLTVEQFQVLRRIRRGIASVSALADANQTSRSAVSKAVDSLVNKGFVSRSHDPLDRRNIPLALTQEGQRTMGIIYQDTERWLAGKFACLDSKDISKLMEAMDILNKIFIDHK